MIGSGPAEQGRNGRIARFYHVADRRSTAKREADGFFVVEGGPQSTNDLMVMDESCARQNGSRVSVLLLLWLLAARNGPFN